jgi:hypothetical protein
MADIDTAYPAIALRIEWCTKALYEVDPNASFSIRYRSNEMSSSRWDLHVQRVDIQFRTTHASLSEALTEFEGRLKAELKELKRNHTDKLASVTSLINE